ncbi:MAG TPA: nucleotidyltransferase domain-containing protein [Blastocatellia bacterium]|nr:nucleotidyltransferase domain-containing protein [Blastocatellia bacterium]
MGLMLEQTDTRRRRAEESAHACARLLKERFGARGVYIFGSLAGESPWHSRSDIDLAVEGLADEDYVQALSALWELLPNGIDLDLITLEQAPPSLVARIKGEVKMPEDPKESLKIEIADEFISLGRIVEEGKAVLNDLASEPTIRDLRAAGSIIHDFYSGVERIFERVAVRLGPGLPNGESWHTLLLRAMESDAEGFRQSVIDHDLALRLVDYLRFRHLFRNSYGYELQWDRLHPLLARLENTFEMLQHQVERFVGSI